VQCTTEQPEESKAQQEQQPGHADGNQQFKSRVDAVKLQQNGGGQGYLDDETIEHARCRGWQQVAIAYDDADTQAHKERYNIAHGGVAFALLPSVLAGPAFVV